MGDPDDVGVGDDLLYELEFGGAGQTERDGLGAEPEAACCTLSTVTARWLTPRPAQIEVV